MGILISSLILNIRTSRSFLFKQFTHTTKRIVAHCVMGGRKGELHCIIICHLPLSLYLKEDPEFFILGCADDTLVLPRWEFMCPLA